MAKKKVAAVSVVKTDKGVEINGVDRHRMETSFRCARLLYSGRLELKHQHDGSFFVSLENCGKETKPPTASKVAEYFVAAFSP